MRMSNPSIRHLVNKSRCGAMAAEGEAATYKGVYGKAALLAFITIVCAIVTESVVITLISRVMLDALIGVIIGLIVCSIASFILALVIAFVPSTAKILGIIYCILQGGLLGCLSLFVDIMCEMPGISVAALLGTAIVFLVSIAVNKLLEVKISSRFMRGLMIAALSILIVQLVMWVLSLCNLFDYTAYLLVQLISSAVCIIWATVMLMWDLQSIDFLVQSGTDKKYEWNVAFSLVTTLIYLYVEILELLMRLAMLFKSKKN